MRGRLISSVKQNVPYYALYVILFIALVCFLYLSSVGKDIVEQGGGLVGVLMGVNMTIGLCQLALTLGYGIVKIPMMMFNSMTLQKRYEYAVYKVAQLEDEILEVLYEKKNSIQQLVYIQSNINCDNNLQPHLDEMIDRVDVALAKTNETGVKSRVFGQKDADEVLIEEYNNGFIDVNRLQKISKLSKDAAFELVRLYTFKMEFIEKSQYFKSILESVVLHKE